MPVTFAGRNQLNTCLKPGYYGSEERNPFRPGTPVLLLQFARNGADDAGRLNFELKTLDKATPHQGETDSFGKKVPDDCPAGQDFADMVHFQDGTKALVGSAHQDYYYTPASRAYELNPLGEVLANYPWSMQPMERRVLLPLNVGLQFVVNFLNRTRQSEFSARRELRTVQETVRLLGEGFSNALKTAAGANTKS